MSPDYYDYDDELSAEELETMAEQKSVSADGITIQVNANCLDRIADAAAHRIGVLLRERVEEMVAKKLDEILDGAWRATVSAMAEKAITEYLTKPRAKTNQWGESIDGKTTMLSSMIPETVTKWLNEPVDDSGSPTSYRSHGTRMQWMLKKLVVDELEAATRKAANDVTQKARELVASHVGRFISEQMVPAISVEKRL